MDSETKGNIGDRYSVVGRERMGVVEEGNGWMGLIELG